MAKLFFILHSKSAVGKLQRTTYTMKNIILYALPVLISLVLLQSCGSDEIETEPERDQQAIEDSLAQVHQAEMEQMRRDSIEQARADSIAAEEERSRVVFTEDGEFVVQVEAWRSYNKAQGQADEWKDRGYDHSFVVMSGNRDTGDIWYRVRIGQFETREMAKNFQTRLLENYQAQAWVSRRDEGIQPEAMQDD